VRKPTKKVLHLNLHRNFPLKGKDLPRNLFDEKESCAGIQMELHPAGVLCDWKGTLFLIPWVDCGPIVLASDEDKP
jgi:hypothetical protein